MSGSNRYEAGGPPVRTVFVPPKRRGVVVRIRRVAWTNASLRGRKFVVLGLHDPGVGRIFPIFALDGQGQAIALQGTTMLVGQISTSVS
jgi:hypothetical protein